MLRVLDTWRTFSVGRRLFVQLAAILLVGIGLGAIAAAFALLPDPYNVMMVGGIIILAALIMIGNLRQVLLLAMIVDIPIQFDTYFFYRLDPAEFGAESGINMSITTVAILVLYALWIGEMLTRKRRASLPDMRSAIPLTIFLMLAIFSLTYAKYKDLSIFEIALLVQTFLFYIYILGTVRTMDEVRYLYTCLSISVIIAGAIMIITYIVGSDINIAALNSRILGSRVGGTIGSPNNAGGFLVITLMPLFGAFLSKQTKWQRNLTVMAIGIGLASLILTQSRGAWVGFALAITLFGFLGWQRKLISTSRILMPVAGAAVVGLIFSPVILGRLTSDDQGAAESRVPLMEMTMRIIEDNPILGIGANNLPLVIQDYVTPDLGRDVWVYAVHNKYLLVWSETGFFSLVAFLSFLLMSLWLAWKVWLRGHPERAPLALGLLLSIMGVMLHMLVDLFHSRPDISQLWFNAALIAILYRMRRDKRSG